MRRLASTRRRAPIGVKEVRPDLSIDGRPLRLRFPTGKLALHFLKREAHLRDGQTAVVDARVDPREHCFPMIPAGAAALDLVEYEEREVVEA